MKFHSAAIAAAALLAMGSAHADTYTLAGELTAADATFNRPLTLTALSGVGTAAHYDSFTFAGVTPGLYEFSTVSTAFDTFGALYAGVFNPASPLTNLVALDDDSGAGSNSLFQFTLTAGTTYTYVTTAFSNTGLGAYVSTITSVVPEPSSYAMLALGIAAIGFAARRRRQD